MDMEKPKWISNKTKLTLSFQTKTLVIQSINIGSDHRLVLGTIKINTRTRFDRRKMITLEKPKINIKLLK
jgi:hypothetical protein